MQHRLAALKSDTDRAVQSRSMRSGCSNYYATMDAQGIGIAKFDSLRKALKSKEYGVRRKHGHNVLAGTVIKSRMEE